MVAIVGTSGVFRRLSSMMPRKNVPGEGIKKIRTTRRIALTKFLSGIMLVQ